MPTAPADAPATAPPDDRWSGADVALALLLALAAATLYLATPQARLTIDGAGLATRALRGDGREYYNVLYLPLVRAVARSWPGPLDLQAVRAAHALFGGLAAGAALLFARRLAVPRWAAVAAAALWALAPGAWFYATTPENHAVHAGVAGLVLVTFLALPWRRLPLALALAALLVPLLFWTQQVALLLGPGMVLLAAAARRRVGAPLRPTTLLLVVGPVLLAGFVLALLGANLVRFGTPVPTVEGQVDQILFDHRDNPTWWTEWLAPLGVVGVLALAGLVLPTRSGRPGPGVRVALLGLLLPPALFFSWWGVEERGGYFLGSGAVYVALAGLALARLPRPSTRLAVVALLVVVQAWLGAAPRRAHDVGWDPADRAPRVHAAIGEEGLLLATSSNALALELDLPRAEEFLLWEAAKQAQVLAGGAAPADALVPWAVRRVDAELSRGRRVALELGWRAGEVRGVEREYFPLLDGVEVALRARFATQELPDPDWPLLVLRPQADEHDPSPPREDTR